MINYWAEKNLNAWGEGIARGYWKVSLFALTESQKILVIQLPEMSEEGPREGLKSYLIKNI